MSERLARAILVALILVTEIGTPLAVSAESPERRAALKLCRQRYHEAIRGTKYLKAHDKKIRRAEAREERRKCRALAPRL